MLAGKHGSVALLSLARGGSGVDVATAAAAAARHGDSSLVKVAPAARSS